MSTTDCPVTFIHPIGGYAFGADAAEFLKEKVKPGGKILALRILPGVDVLETRWSGAKGIFDEAGLNVVGVEFTDGDAAKTKSIVSDYIQREGTLDGVWMDAGATAVAAIEAFEDAGQDVPPITGEDQNDFLTKWKDDEADRRSRRRTRTSSGVRPSSRRSRSSRARRSRRNGSSRSRRSRRRTWTSTSSRTCRRCTTRCAVARTCRASPQKWGGK